MELTYDWKSFQSFFYPKRRSMVRQSSEPVGPVLVVVEEDRIVTAFAEAEDLSDWIGQSCEKMSAELSHRDIVQISREELDSWLSEVMSSATLPHYHDQITYLRTQLKDYLKIGKKETRGTGFTPVVRGHFLFSAIQGWWRRVLPNSFGIFVRLEGQPSEDLFLLFRRGELETFHKPELASMGPERSRQPEDVVKYLGEKHLVPVQGVFVSPRDWQEWSESSNPWGKIVTAVQTDRAKFVPTRVDLLALMTVRGVFGA